MMRVVAVVALVAGIAAGCSRSSATPADAPQASRATTTSTTTVARSSSSTPTSTVAPTAGAPERVVAVAKIPQVAVFDAPAAGGARPARVLRNPTWEGYGLSFLVEESRPDGWLKVNVPVRPNGTTGWIQSADVDLAAVQARVEISLSQHRLRYWSGTSLLLDEPVALGTARTPTPPGSFFVDVIAKPPNPRGAYGPYQVSITAFSEVLHSFDGGVGQLAIHGTNRPDLIGRNVSNGCIRVSNAAITVLAEHVAIGTPVDIVA
jgi:lipoprotein-anchoring transpeptidase ErfK/SrfK